FAGELLRLDMSRHWIRGRSETGGKKGISSEVTVNQEPPTSALREVFSPIRQRSALVCHRLQFVDQPEGRRKGIATEPLCVEGLFKALLCRLKIHFAKALPIFFHPIRRKTKSCRRRKTLQLACSLQLGPMC